MIAEKTKKIEGIMPFESLDLNGRIFLCLFGIDKIPPHLGLIANGKYYSVSAKGNRVGERVNLILRKVKQSEIPSLFIELNVAINEEELAASFNSFPKLTKDQTCLLPIKMYIEQLEVAVSQVNFVFELYSRLIELEKIKNSYSMFMGVNSFEFKTYTKQDIQDRILKLQETC